MVILTSLIFGVPLILAAWLGWTGAKSPPETLREAANDLGKVLLWATAWIGLYLFALVGLMVSGIELRQSALLLVQTAIYWVPVAVIAYIIRAQRERAT